VRRCSIRGAIRRISLDNFRLSRDVPHELTGLPLYPLDMIQFKADGGKVPHDEDLKTHAELLRRDEWIIDGFSVASAWERFAAADTLIYVDLPLTTHFAWVTKRLVKGPFATPAGWPEKSPMRGAAQSIATAFSGSAIRSDPEIPQARRWGRRIKTPASPAIGRSDQVVPRGGQPDASRALTGARASGVRCRRTHKSRLCDRDPLWLSAGPCL
jgi:hypothetical protein